MEYNIALLGNPNVGKTSLYNRITSSKEHVGNWHGVTVEACAKKIKYKDKELTVTDLPGLYSLTVYSPEEIISRDTVYNMKGGVVVCIADAGNISRNLYLAIQLIEAGAPLIIAVNMIDELNKQKLKFDKDKLSKALGVPVVLTSAKCKEGLDALLDCAVSYIENPPKKSMAYEKYLSGPPVNEVENIIRGAALNAALNPFLCAVKAMERDEFFLSKLSLSAAELKKLEEAGDTQGLLASKRYAFIDLAVQGVITPEKKFKKHRLDAVALNKFLAVPLFLLIISAVFFITFGPAGRFFSDTLTLALRKILYEPVKNSLYNAACPEFIIGLLIDGIILGVGGIFAFLPQVVILFLLLALLEDSGYISRVAFYTDGMFQKIGLSGRSVFTMLMGFGCSATAVLTARTLPEENMRKKTMLITPFFSCSARLPVYSCIAAAFFSSGKLPVIILMYLLGAAAAIAIAAALEKTRRFKSGKQSFIMEMPPYRLPSFERVYQIITANIKAFVIRVGTVIFAVNIIVWVLSNFSFTHGYVYGTGYRSILEAIGGFIAPVFAPLGFGSWKTSTSLISGVVAKEVVISTLESLGGVESVFTGPYPNISALSFMVFTLLYCPCIATMSAIKKEAGSKFMWLCFFIQFLSAYAVSLVIYQGAVLFYTNNGVFTGILIMAGIILFAGFMFKLLGGKKNICGRECAACGKCI